MVEQEKDAVQTRVERSGRPKSVSSVGSFCTKIRVANSAVLKKIHPFKRWSREPSPHDYVGLVSS